MDGQNIRISLARVGAALNEVGRNVEILIVGGAAGLLTGQLPASWTTGDVDVMNCHLPADRELVLDAAERVAREFDLPASWMSDFGGLFVWTLPHKWESRRVLVGKFGRLHVYAVGRLDLITMKLLAHRSRDLEHLNLIRPTRDELAFVVGRFDELESDFPGEAGPIAMARQIAAEWQTTR
jgi:hypothetical protein